MGLPFFNKKKPKGLDIIHAESMVGGLVKRIQTMAREADEKSYDFTFLYNTINTIANHVENTLEIIHKYKLKEVDKKYENLAKELERFMEFYKRKIKGKSMGDVTYLLQESLFIF
jgi:predicted  nucleic acid-binding Zn-ribbon protein